MTTGPLSTYRTKADMVYLHLRERIVSGDFAPGQRVVLDKIAAEFGVSKVPIREAVDRLIGEGWLIRSPHVGPAVPVLKAGEVHETALIRAALETVAISEAIDHHTADTLATAKNLLDRMADTRHDDSIDFPRLNVQFHSALIRPCPFQQLTDMTINMMERTMRYQTVNRVDDYRNSAHNEHVLLYEAVSQRNTDKAVNMTERHILDAAIALESRLTT